MKIRVGYVSNSSSSSFICNVCGRTETTYDGCLEDVEMMQCESGHVFCESHKLSFTETVDSIKSFLKRHLGEDGEYWNLNDEQELKLKEFYEKEHTSVEEMENEEGTEFIWDYYADIIQDYGVDYHECPICQFDALTLDDGLNYLLKKYNLTEKDILNELKEKFKDYNEFFDFITEKEEK